jgi:copper chaperone CopZ
MQTLRLEVTNVKCNGCVSAIKSGLGKVAGVTSVEVDLDHGIVDVSGDPLSREEIVGTLSKLGYPAKAPAS